VELCLMIEGQEGVTWPQWKAIARACEEHGVPALFRSDHYMNLDGRHPEYGSLDAWGTLNALAAITSRLRLGTMVSPATFRHPSELAKLVATADHVSNGRVELGLGAGWHEREHAAYGFPFPATKTRMDMLEEQLQIVLGAWTKPGFDFSGAHYQLEELDAQPKPVQQPHPPLIVGGLAGPRGAGLAARFADEYNTVFPTLDDVRTRKQAIEAACEKQGRPPIPLSIMTGVVVGRDRFRRVAEKIGADPDDAPPPGWVTGTVDEAAEQLAALKEAGVSRVMCQHLLHEDLETIAILGGELGPQLR
jgi:F420-dependent oxidoreductase-like protein